MKRLFLLVLLLSGCAGKPPDPIPIKDLRGRWWTYPSVNPLDISAALQARRTKPAFTGSGKVEGGWVCFTSGENVLVGQYREYPGVQEFLDGEHLFDMGSDWNKCHEAVRTLRVREGKAQSADSLPDLWMQLSSGPEYHLISPMSQLDTTDERWKQSCWYEADAPVPCRSVK